MKILRYKLKHFSTQETEIRRERGSIAPRKVFARPETFCTEHTFVHYIWKITEVSAKFLDSLESFKIVLNVSELSGKFRFCPEILRIVWKV